MNGLTQEWHDLAAALTAAGVFTTVDPGQVLTLVTRHGVCALLDRPAEQLGGMGMATIEFTIPVRLVTSGPDDADAVERLDEALLLALPVVQPLQPADWEPWDAADTPMPARTLTARRRIPYPLVVHP
jgi:hypothetical protein